MTHEFIRTTEKGPPSTGTDADGSDVEHIERRQLEPFQIRDLQQFPDHILRHGCIADLIGKERDGDRSGNRPVMRHAHRGTGSIVDGTHRRNGISTVRFGMPSQAYGFIRAKCPYMHHHRNSFLGDRQGRFRDPLAFSLCVQESLSRGSQQIDAIQFLPDDEFYQLLHFRQVHRSVIIHRSEHGRP